MSKIINNTEIRIVGLKRSGNHAIINWLLSHYKGKTCFLNCAQPMTNPFLTFNKDVVKFSRNFYKDFNIDKERKGEFSKKDCLIYSYEDQPLKKVFHKDFEKNHDKFVGKSRKVYNILILRDPFNLFASRIFKYNNMNKKDILKETEAKKLWKSYAKEYLSETNYLGKNKIVISYNEWFLNKDYRKDIAKKLGLNLNDRKINEVLNIWLGSTFDGIKFNGKANKMKVLERWKSMGNNEIYKYILKDKELMKLSERIFGEIPGTKEMIKNKRLHIKKSLWIKFQIIILSHQIKQTVKNKIKEIGYKTDRFIGKFGIFLKKHSPKLYYQLKKLTRMVII